MTNLTEEMINSLLREERVLLQEKIPAIDYPKLSILHNTNRLLAELILRLDKIDGSISYQGDQLSIGLKEITIAVDRAKP